MVRSESHDVPLSCILRSLKLCHSCLLNTTTNAQETTVNCRIICSRSIWRVLLYVFSSLLQLLLCIVFCISYFAHFLLSLFLAVFFSLFFLLFIYFFVPLVLTPFHSCIYFLCFCFVFYSFMFFISNIYLISLLLLTFINLQACSQICKNPIRFVMSVRLAAWNRWAPPLDKLS